MSPFDRRRGNPSPAGQPGGNGTAPDAGAFPARAVAVLLVVTGAAVISLEALVRGVEAAIGAELASLVGLVPARAIGSAVVFPLHGRLVGYAVTEGCTAAFLVAPFFVVAALLIASRRTPPLRGLRAVTAVSLVFFTVNQARLLVVAASMRAWGFQSGYERSHVFLGTMLSTVGALAGFLLFVRLVTKERSDTDGEAAVGEPPLTGGHPPPPGLQAP